MSDLIPILNQIKTYIDSISGTENVYTRKVTLRNEKQLISRFRKADKSNYMGFEIYRVSYRPTFQAFNKRDWIHSIMIDGFLGANDGEVNDASYVELVGLMEDVTELLSDNLTVEGNVTDSEFPVLGDIGLEERAGKVIWVGSITWNLHKHKIFTGSIS